MTHNNDSGNGTINAEVTGRTTQIEVNADGTKTMLTGGTKTVYSWDTDKGETTQRTEAVSFACKAVMRLDNASAPIIFIDEP
jgi:hypothetical protein